MGAGAMDFVILVFPIRIAFYHFFFSTSNIHLSEKMNLGVVPGSRDGATSGSNFCGFSPSWHAQGWHFGSVTSPVRLWYTGRRRLSRLALAIKWHWAALEQNRENFYQFLSLICFAGNNLFCNG